MSSFCKSGHLHSKTFLISGKSVYQYNIAHHYLVRFAKSYVLLSGGRPLGLAVDYFMLTAHFFINLVVPWSQLGVAMDLYVVEWPVDSEIEYI